MPHEIALGNDLCRLHERVDKSIGSGSMQPLSNRILRVLHLVETLEVGGTETQLMHTALRQHSLHHVTVGCLRAEGPWLEPLQRAGIPIVEFRKEKRLLSLSGLREMLRLAIFLRRKNFHVLHAHDLCANLVGVIAARLAGTPIIISSRRHLADLEWWCTRWRNNIIRSVYGLSTHVIVNSASIRDLLVARDGLPSEMIRVIHNGVDVERFILARPDKRRLFPSVESRSKLIAVVANMYSPVKGHDSLIAAASSVCRDDSDTIFVLIGDGRERPTLEQQVKRAGLEKYFLFLGSRTDIPELLACCDISVLPSESEGLPNAVLEAMAAGLPVVATSVGGVPEIIEHEVNGLLVPPQDAVALSAEILRLLRENDLRQRIAQAGRERVLTRFSFTRLVEQLEALYAGPEPELAPRQLQASL